jgi:hypothetical protein
VNFDDLKKRASLATRVVSLCLAGELVEQITVLERQLSATKTATSLEGTGRPQLVEQIEALREEMRESTVDFRLRALGARPWGLFYAAMPTRKEGESDEDWEPRNFEWQADMVSRTCVDPVMTVEQVGELVELLHLRSWTELASEAFMVNMGGLDIPNSAAVSDLTGDSEQT